MIKARGLGFCHQLLLVIKQMLSGSSTGKHWASMVYLGFPPNTPRRKRWTLWKEAVLGMNIMMHSPVMARHPVLLAILHSGFGFSALLEPDMLDPGGFCILHNLLSIHRVDHQDSSLNTLWQCFKRGITFYAIELGQFRIDRVNSVPFGFQIEISHRTKFLLIARYAYHCQFLQVPEIDRLPFLWSWLLHIVMKLPGIIIMPDN